MKKANNLLKNVTRMPSQNFDDLYDEISRGWENKAQKLRQRRGQKFADEDGDW
jgi:hypothetical protein